MEIYKKYFGKKLRIQRNSLNLTQENLAVAMGVEASSVSRWETGEDFPDDDRLPLLCKTLGVGQDYFVPESQSAPIEGHLGNEILSEIHKLKRVMKAQNNLDPEVVGIVNIIRIFNKKQLAKLRFAVDNIVGNSRGAGAINKPNNLKKGG